MQTQTESRSGTLWHTFEITSHFTTVAYCLLQGGHSNRYLKIFMVLEERNTSLFRGFHQYA